MRGLRTSGGVIRASSAIVRLIGAFALIAAFLVFGAAPARAGENTFVEVTPNSVQAGARVHIRASCDNSNNRQAEVTSDAFNRVFLRPDNGFLTGDVTIPNDKAAGDYPVHLRCDNGQKASTNLNVLNMDQPTKGPATGGGGTAGRSTGSMLLLGGAATVTAAVVFGLFSSRRRTGS